MSLETGNRIADLVATNPVGATDFVSQGDDHIRLLKACVKGSLPNLGATAVSVAAEKINFLADVSSPIQAQLDARQPLDTDLTAIAALTTTSHGRGFLTQADAAASRAYIGAQADDADLTAIAALTTQTYGRGFLTLADDAALAAKIAAIVPTWTGAHIFSSTLTLNGNNGAISQNTTSARFWRVTTTGGDALFGCESSVAGNVFGGSDAYAAVFGSMVNRAAHILTNGTVRVTVEAAGGLLAPKCSTSTSTSLVAGKIHHIASAATLPALADGEWVAIVNNSGSPIVITEHSGDTTYWTAAALSVSTVTVPARGRIVASGAGSNVVYVSGDISGST